MKFVLFLIKEETIIDHKTRFWNKAVPLAIQDIYLSKYGANSYKKYMYFIKPPNTNLMSKVQHILLGNV